ncbi:MAG: hypothetical protein K8R48_10230 [Alphaproteobacteria bacterium]|nr:hypothetical protein [Alphaproteobacteria bacterium]
MMKLIGLKRVIAICILLGINFGVFSVYLTALAPMLEDAQRQLRAVDGQISDLRSKITTAKQETAFVKENLPKYQELQDRGLFLEQDRFMIDRLLQDMRSKAGIANFSFAVGDLTAMANADAESIGYTLSSSRISVDKIISPLDNNIYAFLQDIRGAFPEYTRLQKFSIQRTAKVNEQLLNDLSDGKQVSAVGANIVFDWMTLVPNAAGQSQDAAGAGRR